MLIQALYESLYAAIETIMSAVIGIDLHSLKKILDKKKMKDTPTSELSENIDKVSLKLEESKEIIENALAEMEKQKRLFEEMKREAEISQQITSMNSEQVEALNNLLEATLNKQEKKSFPKNFFWNLFFCVLSAVLGYILGKFV